MYTLPNFFGESPAVQISAAKSIFIVDSAVLSKVQDALGKASLSPSSTSLDVGRSLKVGFDRTEDQLRAKELIQKAINTDLEHPSYIVALNLIPRSPTWLSNLHADPMYLGLDLRGGVHFMLQVDMLAALTKRADSLAGDIRIQLREKNIRHSGISRDGQAIDIIFKDKDTLDLAAGLIKDQFAELQTSVASQNGELKLHTILLPQSAKKFKNRRLNKTSPHSTTESMNWAYLNQSSSNKEWTVSSSNYQVFKTRPKQKIY